METGKECYLYIKDFATGIFAVCGLAIAFLTYKVAKEAKEEWKMQKHLDFYIRFARLFPIAKEYIEALRNHYSDTGEISEKRLKQFKNGEPLTDIEMRTYMAELVVYSRMDRFADEIKEFKKLKFESTLYLGSDSAIVKFMSFVLETERLILKSARQQSLLNRILFDPSLHQEYKKQQQERYRDSWEIIYGTSNDSVDHSLQDHYKECQMELERIRVTTHTSLK